MTQPFRRTAFAGALVALLAACQSPTATTTPSAAETPSSPAATSTADASTAASQPPSEGATPTASEAGTGFQVAPHPGADSLFLDRDECDAADAGFRVQYPDAWWTNTAVGDTGPCAWYAPSSFDADDDDAVPDGVMITIEIVPEDAYSGEDSPNREEGVVGETQNAVRVEEGGEYTYLVQLGPPGAGPTLIARTTSEMGGDYELNKAVLDRIMATMEFIGTIE